MTPQRELHYQTGRGRLDGTGALITGAGFGIGRGIARRFAREGGAVFIAESNLPAGERTAQKCRDLGVRAHFVPTDVGDKRRPEGGHRRRVAHQRRAVGSGPAGILSRPDAAGGVKRRER